MSHVGWHVRLGSLGGIMGSVIEGLPKGGSFATQAELMDAVGTRRLARPIDLTLLRVRQAHSAADGGGIGDIEWQADAGVARVQCMVATNGA